MSTKRNLDDYVTVAERIQEFYEKYPKGSLRTEILEIDDKRVLIKASAYREPDDPAPANGHAEEVRRGPVNTESAVENAETSAWGRAIAALGFAVKKGIASREEMQRAEAAQKSVQEQSAVVSLDPEEAEEQKGVILDLFGQLEAANGRSPVTKGNLQAWFAAARTNDDLDKVIAHLREKLAEVKA